MVTALSWTAFCSSALFSNNPIKSSFESIQFELVNGLIVLSASVNGEEGNFILDTGSPQLLLNSRVKKADFACVSLDRVLKAKYVDVDHMQIGSFEKHQFEAWATNLSFLEELLDRNISGLIGLDVMTESRLWIDYENRQIFLLPQDMAGLPVNLSNSNLVSLDFELSEEGMPVVELQVENQPLTFAFDTGAGLSVIDKKMAESISKHKADTNENIPPQLNHLDLKMDYLNVKKLPFISSNLNKFNNDSSIKIDGILSVYSLNAQQVLIDYKKKKIHIFWKTNEA